jgi:hypothetical protein
MPSGRGGAGLGAGGIPASDGVASPAPAKGAKKALSGATGPATRAAPALKPRQTGAFALFPQPSAFSLQPRSVFNLDLRDGGLAS